MNNLVSHWDKTEIILISPTIKSQKRDFPGGPVVRTLYFHCREHRFSPWLTKRDPVCSAKKKSGIKYSQLGFWIVTLNPDGSMYSSLRLCVRRSLLQILLCCWVGSSPCPKLICWLSLAFFHLNRFLMKYIILYIWNSNGVEQKKQALATTSNAFWNYLMY